MKRINSQGRQYSAGKALGDDLRDLILHELRESGAHFGNLIPKVIKRSFHCNGRNGSKALVEGQPVYGHSRKGTPCVEITRYDPHTNFTASLNLGITGVKYLIQNRYDGSVNFYKTWDQYKNGFGSLSGEFWIGNDNIHTLTYTNKYMLRVDLTDNSGDTRYAEYYIFRVSDEADKYRLIIGEYYGDAG
ncbi:unnamed protein product [Mytilus coruscus]|uniref:Fibrinogen C-terminal domain-containing protein n=1 Tax=Mytilus coruscus TaxID=42192 RepID=A0A6J8C786_MYTCO|nr:unnamed protein product [Mytilus coruscus]